MSEKIKSANTPTVNNPIIDNRIVSDITFAIRLRNFVKDIICHDHMTYEEKEAILYTANRLIEYQKQTATDKNEIDYIKYIREY